MNRPLKYTTPLIVYLLAVVSFTSNGLACWLALVFTWVCIPLLELFLQPDPTNLTAEAESLAKINPWYDVLLYSVVILQYIALGLFLWQMAYSAYSAWDAAARVLTMGLLCGIFGINAGHELGHRAKTYEQLMAKALLLTSLYMHFFIEHNKGHHKHVATEKDPASARLWEPVYSFYFRTVIFSYISAWKIALKEARRKGYPALGVNNEMLQYQLVQAACIVLILLLFGVAATLYFFSAALIGIGLLETVNYIEHYGLRRKKTGDGRYERPLPVHSWNSDHLVGRLMLFELSRHSDHHYLASRKYQVLRHHDFSPQMPTGYPGMMILSLLPPAWFYVMHRQMKQQGILLQS